MNHFKHSHFLIGATILLVVVAVCLVLKNMGQAATLGQQANLVTEKLSLFQQEYMLARDAISVVKSNAETEQNPPTQPTA